MSPNYTPSYRFTTLTSVLNLIVFTLSSIEIPLFRHDIANFFDDTASLLLNLKILINNFILTTEFEEKMIFLIKEVNIR